MKIRGAPWWSLAAIVVVAFVLRYQASQQALWLDELHTGWVVAGGWSDIDLRARLGNATPLYFYCVSCLTHLFGLTPGTLRSLSVIAGGFLVPASYLLVWRWGGCMIGALLAALLVALDPDFLFFASEARPYALLQLVALAQVACFWWALSDRDATDCDATAGDATPWGFFAGVLGAVLMWIHVTAAPLLLAELLFALRYPHGVRNAVRGAGRYGWVCCIVASLLLYPRLHEIFLRRTNWNLFIAPLRWDHLVDLLPIVPYLIIPAAALIASRWLDRGAPEQPNDRCARFALLWTIYWFVIPIGLAALCTYLEIARLFFTRYLMVPLLAPPILAGLLIGYQRRWYMKIATALAVIIVMHGGSMWQFADNGTWPLPIRPQGWDTATAYVAEHRSSDAVLLLDAGLIERPWVMRQDPSVRARWRDYLLFPIRSVYQTGIPAERQAPIATNGPRGLLEFVESSIWDSTGTVWVLVARLDRSTTAGVAAELSRMQGEWDIGTPLSFGSLHLTPVTRRSAGPTIERAVEGVSTQGRGKGDRTP
jgi:mannosyltransferase